MAFYKNLTQAQVIERLTAQDVRTVMLAAEEGDYEFIASIIQGDGFTQYNHMKPGDLIAEYGEREDRIIELIEDGLMPYEVE